ncbi:MAG: asparagine--tRNA ligase [Spirochaetaceae bacterium]|jgi:asparaginyl-tRNA synthetase|nr:asparagine--tRNA ligase [Spirochaetaceae bacterium]
MFPLIREILSMPGDSRELKIRGWVKTKRDMKKTVFVDLNDGSCLRSIQCTFDQSLTPDAAAILSPLGTGASVEITGRLVPSPAPGQEVEIAASSIRLVGDAPGEEKNGIPPYPLQKKRHSLEFLREIPQLRGRTNTLGAVMRVRSALAFAVHRFFHDRGYQYLHTPVITGHDAEGAGAMFRVTTLDMTATKGAAAYAGDFFGGESFLTVSGQLEAETYATALSRVYTFGPAFRAENSSTPRHLAEFWMIEPETAFFDLTGNMDLAEDFLHWCLGTILDECGEDLEFFNDRIEPGLIGTLRSVQASPFARISYTDAMAELEKAWTRHGSFEFKPRWGCDLQSEHEKFLTEEVIRGPVIVTGYPKEIKAFYMKLNEDGKTVRAMDVLVPRLGEIIGGSEREENLEVLMRRMEELGIKEDRYNWYLDLRRYGTVPHSGFGLGFERLVQYITGMANIRDVIPYPRAAGQLY